MTQSRIKPGSPVHAAAAGAYEAVLAALRGEAVTVTGEPDLAHLHLMCEALARLVANEMRRNALGAAGGDEAEATASAITTAEIRLLAWNLPGLAAMTQGAESGT